MDEGTKLTYDTYGPITKRKKLPVQWIAKPFKAFSVYYVFKKLKKLKILQLITK